MSATRGVGFNQMQSSRIEKTPSLQAAGGLDSRPAPAAPPATSAEAPRDTFTFVYDAREAPALSNVRLKGSFDPATGRYDALWNGGRSLPMYDDGTHGDAKAGDDVYTAQVQLDPSDKSTFQWGVEGSVMGRDGKIEQSPRWLVMTEEPPRFTLDGRSKVLEMRPVATRDMGCQRDGDTVRFKTWAPAMGSGKLAGYTLHVELFDENGDPVESIPMTKDERTGTWSAEVAGGWARLEGKGYRYAARDGQGQALVRHFADGSTRPVVYGDPYARYVQGPQRGLESIHVDPVLGVETGWYNASDNGGPDYSINPHWARFSVPGRADAERVTLRLADEQGRALDKQQLLARLGAPSLVPYANATAEQRRNVDTLRRWQVDTSSPVTQYSWLDRVSDDGTIDLQRVGDANTGTSWVAVVNNFPALQGLRYQFEVRDGGGIVGDANGDGQLAPAEARRTPFNEPWSNVITAHPGNERMSLVRESSFTFRHDNAPRKESDPHRYVIYEAHVGAFMGSRDNAHASTFADMMAHLDYVEKLGANTIEIMPVQEFGGDRDWGYTPDFMFAGAEAYGFEMPRADAVRLGVVRPNEQTDRASVWVSGTDAFKLFVDEAHRRGFNVLSDVVYNHVAGRPDAQNPLDLIDGDAQSFFKWNGTHVSETPWGAKPNFGAQAVKDFYTANAVQQLTEFHVDGMRFDFVQVLHDTGSVDEKREGMKALRQISRTVEFVRPGTYTVAEDFTHNWLVAADLDKSEWQGEGSARMEKRGMGFDGVWSDSFHHTLLDAVEGKANMDTLVSALSGHRGVSRPEQAVVYAHSHDEVGNSGRWVIRSAAGSVKESDVQAFWPRAMGRTAAALTLASTGVPMIWQGEENLANNDFKHGMPQTWGADTGWLDFAVTPDRLDDFRRISALPAGQKEAAAARLGADEQRLFARYDRMGAREQQRAEFDANKNGHFRLYRDLIALRGASTAMAAHTAMAPIYTHNANRVMAFTRQAQGEQFLVVSNFSRNRYDAYDINLPPGRWRVMLNSDDRVYGGEGMGSHGDVGGGQALALPAGGTLILKKIGAGAPHPWRSKSGVGGVPGKPTTTS